MFKPPEGCAKLIWKIIITIVPNEIPNYDFLEIFNVSLNTIQMLKRAEDEYNKETNISKLNVILLYIHDNYFYDYNILKIFFFTLQKRVSIQVYDFPIEVTIAQLKRFKEEYELLPGEKLPECAGLYYVCTSCGILKTIPKTKNLPRKGGDRKKKKKRKEKESIRKKTWNMSCWNYN